MRCIHRRAGVLHRAPGSRDVPTAADIGEDATGGGSRSWSGVALGRSLDLRILAQAQAYRYWFTNLERSRGGFYEYGRCAACEQAAGG